MNIKSLLLGSATAVAVVGGAQAADLSVAEPVDYVRVCDAFGVGYWYIPGTDTCLKIGGYVQFDINFHADKNVLHGDPLRLKLGPGFAVSATLDGDHVAQYDMGTEASIQVTAKSMTEYGPLTGYVEMRAKSNNSQSGPYLGATYTTAPFSLSVNDAYASTDKNAYLDSAWLELGMILAGRTGSVYDYGGGFNFDGSDYDSDNTADQVRLSWAASGFGVQLAVEDPRDRWGTSIKASSQMPNIVGNISMAQANWDAKLSAAYGETWAGSGFGVQAAATFKLDSIAPGDQLRLKAAFANNEVSSWGASNDGSGVGPGIPVLAGGNIWSALASFQHFWTPTLSSAVTFSYANQDGGTTNTTFAASFPPPAACGTAFGGFFGLCTAGAMSVYSVYGNLVWSPVTGFFAGVEGGYTKASTSTKGVWTAKIRMKRSW